MNYINRSAFIIRPKEPYLKWAIKIDPEGESHIEYFKERVSVYLVSQDPKEEQETAPLKGFYKTIFEEELAAWHLDESAWPQPRTLKMFYKWFEVKGESMIADLGKGPLQTEEL